MINKTVESVQLCAVTMAVTGVTAGRGQKDLISKRAKQTLKLEKLARPSYGVNMFFHSSVESLHPVLLTQKTGFTNSMGNFPAGRFICSAQ